MLLSRFMPSGIMPISKIKAILDKHTLSYDMCLYKKLVLKLYISYLKIEVKIISTKNLPKIDFFCTEKVDELEKNHERVREVVIRWARKSVKDKDLPWESAMKNAAEELGLNKAEFVTLVSGREVLEDVAYAIGIIELGKRRKLIKRKKLKPIHECTKGWSKC